MTHHEGNTPFKINLNSEKVVKYKPEIFHMHFELFHMHFSRHPVRV